MKNRYLAGLAVAIALAAGTAAFVQFNRQGSSTPAGSAPDSSRPSFAFGGSHHSSGWEYPYGYGDYPYYGFGYPYGAFDPITPLMLNASHAGTADVQDALSKAGYYKGTADGILNKDTRAAISAYQRDKGLPVTGSVDTELLQSLGLK